MEQLTKIINKKHFETINQYQLLKEVFYSCLNTEENKEKVREWMNSEKGKNIINRILEPFPEYQPKNATSAMTFLWNWIKD